MQLYICLLKAFLDFKVYSKYYNALNLDFIQKNFPEVYKLYSVLPELHSSKQDKVYSPLDLELCLLKEYPKADPVFYRAVLADLEQQQVDPIHVESYLSEITERSQALEAAKLALKVSDGLLPFGELKQRFESMKSAAPAKDWRSKIVTDDLEELYQQHYKKQGFRWRLTSLNKALGSLRKGDFGFIFARPETGKTTFLASEMSFMCEQLQDGDGPIVWFNNEEQGEKVKVRSYQAVLGLEVGQVYEDRPKNHQLFKDKTRGKFIIYNEKVLTKNEVEMVCEELKPSIIIFDQIDKITGFQADRNDLELKELYSWARALAEKYGPVIAVCQAGGSGDNKQWLTMNDVDSSKTAKQGEADWILGIGFVFDPGKEYIRYLHLSKNKLVGDPDSDPQMRHGKWSCFIKPEIAQYKDFNEDGTA